MVIKMMWDKKHSSIEDVISAQVLVGLFFSKLAI
jgi:hypothetical protein